MTPAARVQAAIDVLSHYLDGLPLEKAFLAWSRGSRFAGSKDRAAVRDYVFDAVRKRASLGAWPTGDARLWMAASLEQKEYKLSDIFNGQGYAPSALSQEEVDVLHVIRHKISFDLQDWVFEKLQADYGNDAADIAHNLKNRAPISLRVNTAITTVSSVQKQLMDHGIQVTHNPVCSTALTVQSGDRRIKSSPSFLSGKVELQDAASQAICEKFQVNGSVLDYCAGGGGKSLAFAMSGADVFAHDIDFKRMQDIPNRAKRAGIAIKCLKKSEMKAMSQFDGVFCDVPCSGSGAWRRSPDYKWRISSEELTNIIKIQQDIVKDAMPYVRSGGLFAYATCSIFKCENQQQETWISNMFPDLVNVQSQQYLPSIDCDGFFITIFQKN